MKSRVIAKLSAKAVFRLDLKLWERSFWHSNSKTSYLWRTKQSSRVDQHGKRRLQRKDFRTRPKRNRAGTRRNWLWKSINGNSAVRRRNQLTLQPAQNETRRFWRRKAEIWRASPARVSWKFRNQTNERGHHSILRKLQQNARRAASSSTPNRRRTSWDQAE